MSPRNLHLPCMVILQAVVGFFVVSAGRKASLASRPTPPFISTGTWEGMGAVGVVKDLCRIVQDGEGQGTSRDAIVPIDTGIRHPQRKNHRFVVKEAS